MAPAIIRFIERHRIVVSRVFVAAFFVAVWVCKPVFEGSLVATALFLVGLVLVAIATVGRLWCSLYISGNKDSELVTVGPYSVTRNPLYFFSFIGFAGIGFATETITFALVLAGFFAVVYPIIIAAEERFLSARFGAAFEAYRASTPRFIPSWSRYVEPQTWIVNTRLFRRTMFDAIWFVWIVGLLELIEALHEHGVVIARFTVP